MQSFTLAENIKGFTDKRQGYTHYKPRVDFGDHTYEYTEDTGTFFTVTYGERKLGVSSVCDGHAGYETSFTVTSIIQRLFGLAISESLGCVKTALLRLFEMIATEILTMEKLLGNSGATCNVTVFDPANEKVFVASLGDSPTMLYRKDDNGNYKLLCKSKDQDCADTEEIERMIEIHKKNGELNATAESVVFEVEIGGKKTGVFRNKRSQMMIHSSFGDYGRDYYKGVVNTVPRVYEWDFAPSDNLVVVQCSDGLLEWLQPSFIGIQPSTEFRTHEIGTHLDECNFTDDENAAFVLHELQIDSILKKKIAEHPFRSDSTREWVVTTFDNHITNVFVYE